MESVQAGDMETACDILLDYYDKTYSYGLSRRDKAKVHRVEMKGLSTEQMAERLIPFVERLETATQKALVRDP